jgi:opacity protein-like surface antigen
MLCGLAAPGLAAAQPVSGPYVSLGAGINILPDDVVRPYGGYGPDKRMYGFDPGPAAFAGVGWGFGNGLRLEAEGDYANNHVRKVVLQAPFRAGGFEQQYGGFVNALYDLGLGLPVTPYFGVGAGYQTIGLDGVNSGYVGSPSTRLNETKGAFAYQAIAGVSYPLPVAGLSLKAEYRFIGVLTPPPYDRGGAFRNGVYTPLRATFGNIFNNEIMVGLRYTFGAPPPPPHAIAFPDLVLASRSYLVFFDWDRADLTQRARQIVREAAEHSTRGRYTRIEVDGYTDTSGTPAYNQRLSVRRAEAVAAELVRDGVPRAAIAIQGFGETHPLVSTGDGVREPQNRRVEIIFGMR